MQKNFRNYDVEILNILTVYVYISDDRIIFYLMMSKGPWGGRGAEFYSYATMYNLMMAAAKAETCSC